MELKRTFENQMDLFLDNPKPWIFMTITFATFLIFGSFSIIFTSTVVVIFSTSFLMFMFSKRKHKVMEDKDFPIRKQHDYLMQSPDMLSENECLDQLSTTEDSEVDNIDRTPDFSDDGSISDEDSLIEISLPGGHYVGHKLEVEEQPKFGIQQKLPDLLQESFFQQRSALMELLAELNEMNEEENLIEIDISIGSIKCSRFEIEA